MPQVLLGSPGLFSSPSCTHPWTVAFNTWWYGGIRDTRWCTETTVDGVSLSYSSLQGVAKMMFDIVEALFVVLCVCLCLCLVKKVPKYTVMRCVGVNA